MCRKMQESGLTEITPLMCTSALWASVQCFLIPSLLGYITGGGCRMRFNGCSILGLLIWQATFFIEGLQKIRILPFCANFRIDLPIRISLIITTKKGWDRYFSPTLQMAKARHRRTHCLIQAVQCITAAAKQQTGAASL